MPKDISVNEKHRVLYNIKIVYILVYFQYKSEDNVVNIDLLKMDSHKTSWLKGISRHNLEVCVKRDCLSENDRERKIKIR